MKQARASMMPAKECGVTRYMLNKLCIEAGIVLKPQDGDGKAKQKRQSFAALYKDGIAKLYASGVNYQKISDLLNARGLKISNTMVYAAGLAARREAAAKRGQQANRRIVRSSRADHPH